ncbi:MAG: hypothetical protein IJS00_05580 [Paludibacteraceae bacterium]|nr:hypothetical protein [Paludibacteraceae bacterium]
MSYTLDETELAAMQGLVDFIENAFVGMQDDMEAEMARHLAWVVEDYFNIILMTAKEQEESKKQEEQ